MAVYVLFIIGFVLLIKGAGWLVDGASAAAGRLRISQLVIGLTVVAFGTSAPELSVNVIASIEGAGDIAIGNIVGSNIFNTFVILGVSALIFPLAVGKGTVWKEIPFTLLAAVILAVMANDRLLDRGAACVLSRGDGFILLAFFIIFMCYTFGIARAKDVSAEAPSAQERAGLLKSFLRIIVGLVCLSVGAKWVVDGAVALAEGLGVSRSLIALTVVAAGTSLPELATSAVAAYKRNPDIAVGNIVGSNIFNIFFVLGVSSVIRPIPFHSGGNIDIGVCILGSVLLFIFMFSGRRRSLDRWEAVVFLILYLAYLAFIVGRR